MGRNVIEVLVKAKDKASADLKKVGGNVGKVGQAVTVAAAAIAAAGVVIGAAMVKMINQTARWGDTIAKSAKQIGVTTEFLSEMEHAAKISGATMADVLTGIKRMSRAASDASIGLETYKRAFDYLGISVTTQSGQLKDTEALFMELAQAMSEVDNATKKAALAQELFGRGALPLIPLLNEGAEGIEALRKEAQALGVSLSGETAEAMEDYVDSITRLQAAFKGLQIQMSKKFTSPIIDALGGLTDILKDPSWNNPIVRYLILSGYGGPVPPGFDLAGNIASPRSGGGGGGASAAGGGPIPPGAPPPVTPTPVQVPGAPGGVGAPFQQLPPFQPALEAATQLNTELEKQLELVNPLADAYNNLFTMMDFTGLDAMIGISSTFGDMVGDIVRGVEDIEQRWKDMLLNMAANFISAIARMAAFRALVKLFPGVGLFMNSGGEWIPAQRGLEAVGGQYGRDTIPAGIGKGEVVVPSPTVERLNKFLDTGGGGRSININPMFFSGSREEAAQAAEYVRRQNEWYDDYVVPGVL